MSLKLEFESERAFRRMLLGRWNRAEREGLDNAVRMTSFGEAYGIPGANVREKTTLENPGVDGRIILKWYVKKRGVQRIHHSRDTCVCVCVGVCVCACVFAGWTGLLNKRSNETMISGSLSPRHGASSDCGWKNGLQYGG
jgi:hypothetical protein